MLHSRVRAPYVIPAPTVIPAQAGIQTPVGAGFKPALPEAQPKTSVLSVSSVLN